MNDTADFLDEAQARIEVLESEARRYYRADGSYETLDSAEAVVARRIEAAGTIEQLRKALSDLVVADMNSLPARVMPESYCVIWRAARDLAFKLSATEVSSDGPE